MSAKIYHSLLICCLLGFAYWFFGNLYEQIAMIPNHLFDTYEVMKGYQAYFSTTSPVIYFVPFTQITFILLIVLYFICKKPDQKRLLKRASIFATLSIVLTAVIVTQINLKLFAPQVEIYKDKLYQLSLWWLAGNTLRLILVGITLVYIFKTIILSAISNKTNSNPQ